MTFRGATPARFYRSIKRLTQLPDEGRMFMCHDYKAPGRDTYAWETTVGAERTGNIHTHDGVSEDEFVAMRTARDATLAMPKLIPAVGAGEHAGRPDAPGGRKRCPVPEDSRQRPLTTRS